MIVFECLVFPRATAVRKLSENSSRGAATMDSNLVKFLIRKVLEAIKPLEVGVGWRAESDADW